MCHSVFQEKRGLKVELIVKEKVERMQGERKGEREESECG